MRSGPVEIITDVVVCFDSQSSWEHDFASIIAKTRDRRCWQEIVVGGCCKASHADISELRRKVLGDYNPQSQASR
jgi:hypothetical protein